MSEIKIVEKIVAPNTNWTQLILKEDDESLARCAYKIIFDRTYPYFWISGDFIDEFLVVITNAVIFIGSGKIVMNAVMVCIQNIYSVLTLLRISKLGNKV